MPDHRDTLRHLRQFEYLHVAPATAPGSARTSPPRRAAALIDAGERMLEDMTEGAG